jgi:hypothetical protein
MMRRWMDHEPECRNHRAIGFTLTLALLVVSARLSCRNTRQLVDTDLMMDHTHRVISLLETVLSTLNLQPYHEAVMRCMTNSTG